MSNPHSLHYQVALSAAIQAGDILRDMRASGFETKKKGARDLLTSADIAAEKIIIGEIRKHFPNHYILSEEASPETTTQLLMQDHVWIIDPIDGTTNFVHGHFMVATSIAYASRGIVKIGIVHAPFLKETFAAERDHGATLNGQAIQCAQIDSLTDLLVATGFPYQRDRTKHLTQRLQAVLDSCRDIRRLGSAALDTCWVACGRLDAYYETCKVWDIAAAALIAREAGAKTGTIGELPNEWAALGELCPHEFVATNNAIFNQFTELLRKASV